LTEKVCENFYCFKHSFIFIPSKENKTEIYQQTEDVELSDAPSTLLASLSNVA